MADFLRVALPLSKPALAMLAVLSFLTNWNDFVWPVYVLFSPENQTLPPGLSTLQGAYDTDYPVIMAGRSHRQHPGDPFVLLRATVRDRGRREDRLK